MPVVRRLLSVLTVAACLLVVPQVAMAALTAKASVTQTVSTASLSRPTDVAGTWSCQAFVIAADRARVNVSGLTATNPAGTTYRYELLNGSRVLDSASTSSTGTPVTLEAAREDSSRSWTVRVRPELRSWNTAWTERTFTCRALISTDGDL